MRAAEQPKKSSLGNVLDVIGCLGCGCATVIVFLLLLLLVFALLA
jgi:hypothetical protein